MQGAFRWPSADALPAWMQPFARTIDAMMKLMVPRSLERADWNKVVIRLESIT